LLPPDPVFKAPKLIVPHEVRAPKPQPQEIEPPKVAMNNFAPAVLKPTSGARPVLIHTGEFPGKFGNPDRECSDSKVQTGGFGDPNGLKPSANSKPNGKLIAATAGSFDMPVGPGQGNGSGGAKGIKGTVASADFGNGVATRDAATDAAAGTGNVQTSGFGSQEVAQKRRMCSARGQRPRDTSVEITLQAEPGLHRRSKKSETGRRSPARSGIRGNGQLHVNRVVRGLGHGLDEAAVAAANKMRFKPAMRTGRRWIRQQSCTWYFNWRTETLEIRVMRKVMSELVG
jgi:hypothetical protein